MLGGGRAEQSSSSSSDISSARSGALFALPPPAPLLESFAAYCQPLKNVPFERYKFYSRMQEGVAKKGSEKLMREIPGNINLWEIQKTALKGNSTHSTEGPIHQVTKLPSAPGPRFGLGPWRRNRVS